MAAKSNDGYDGLKKDLEAKNPGILYVFYGEETYLRDRAVENLLSLASGDGLEDFNISRLAGKGLSAAEIAEAADCCPVMADRRFVIVTDFAVMKPSAADTAAVAEMINNLPDSVCLVFIYDTLEYKQDKKNKACAAVFERGRVVEFKKRTVSELSRWIARRFETLGKRISAADCEFLIDYSGSLMTGLNMEIEKIAAYSDQDTVGRGDIEAVASPSPDTAVYQMTDAVIGGRTDAALSRLRELFFLGYKPPMLSAALCKQILRLYSARLCLDEGKGPSHLAEMWGMKQYPAEKLMASARGVSVRSLRRALSICGQGDIELKTSYGDEGKIMELLLLKVADSLKG